MNESNRLKYLRLALQVFGAICTFGFYPLTILWPSGFEMSSVMDFLPRFAAA